MAFFDASGLYALNPQQEALNCIILFSVIYDVDRPFYFRPVSKVFITAFPFFNRAIKGVLKKIAFFLYLASCK